LQHDPASQGWRLKLGIESPLGYFKLPLLAVAGQLKLQLDFVEMRIFLNLFFLRS
jgi:hypothetical protein